MMRTRCFRLGLTAFAAAAMLCVAGCDSTSGSIHLGWNNYGGVIMDHDEEPVALGVIEDDYTGPLIVEGDIKDVCQMKGCWMILKDGDREVRVKFKDYAFFVPMNSAGHHAIVKGWGNPTVMDVEWARHLAEDAGKSKEEIEAITEPVKTYEIEATAVYIEGEGLNEPHSEG